MDYFPNSSFESMRTQSSRHQALSSCPEGSYRLGEPTLNRGIAFIGTLSNCKFRKSCRRNHRFWCNRAYYTTYTSPTHFVFGCNGNSTHSLVRIHCCEAVPFRLPNKAFECRQQNQLCSRITQEGVYHSQGFASTGKAYRGIRRSSTLAMCAGGLLFDRRPRTVVASSQFCIASAVHHGKTESNLLTLFKGLIISRFLYALPLLKSGRARWERLQVFRRTRHTNVPGSPNIFSQRLHP